jgi:hypothetical protein
LWVFFSPELLWGIEVGDWESEIRSALIWGEREGGDWDWDWECLVVPCWELGFGGSTEEEDDVVEPWVLLGKMDMKICEGTVRRSVRAVVQQLHSLTSWIPRVFYMPKQSFLLLASPPHLTQLHRISVGPAYIYNYALAPVSWFVNYTHLYPHFLFFIY